MSTTNPIMSKTPKQANKIIFNDSDSDSDDESVASSIVSETESVDSGNGERVDEDDGSDAEEAKSVASDDEDDDGADVEDESDDDDEDEETEDKSLTVQSTSKKGKTTLETKEESDIMKQILETTIPDEEVDLDSDEDDEEYLKKFDESVRRDVILQHHPEILQTNYDEVSALVRIVRDEDGNIIDPLHRTIPLLTKYEKARVLGLRAKQINQGNPSFVKVPDNIIDGHLIAEMELKAKAIPFIISRPLPGGRKEYWKVSDLEMVDF